MNHCCRVNHRSRKTSCSKPDQKLHFLSHRQMEYEERPESGCLFLSPASAEKEGLVLLN